MVILWLKNLTEGKIIVNKDSQPMESTAVALGINTSLSLANAQVEAMQDIKAELAEQQQIAKAVNDIKAAVTTYSANKQQEAEQEVRRLERAKEQALAQGNREELVRIEQELITTTQQVKDWGTGGQNKRIADTVSAVVGVVLAGKSGAELGTVAISPWVNQQIKEMTTDSQTGEVDKVTNAIAHAVWGAIEAVSAGGNASAGAISAASAELAAPLLAQALYGTTNSQQLTETQKQNITNLTALAGAIGAGLTESQGSGTEIFAQASQGGEIGRRAVENNFFSTVLDNPTMNWQGMAAEYKVKQELEEEIREYIKQEHPIMYQTMEGTYYILSKTGKAIYISREIALDVVPMLLVPEIAVGSKIYTLASSVAISAGANIAAQKLSGQEFNNAEFAGAVVSGAISPRLKSTMDVVRFNTGVGMAVGLANGGDGLSDAVLSGVGAYGASKVSNPIMATITNEAIQKTIIVPELIFNKEEGNNN